MKRTILSIAGALALSLSAANAQEADRFVGAQHVKFQTACHPEDVKHYDTKLLRERFVMEKVMAPDSILLTYSHYDRFIFGGAMPVNTTLKLENFWELGLDVDNTIKEKYFMYNRELGVVNCGLGDGVVIVDGKEYALSPKEALYSGRGHIAKDQDVNKSVQFRSKDPKNPAKFYLNSATAHQHYKTQWITLDGRKGSHCERRARGGSLPAAALSDTAQSRCSLEHDAASHPWPPYRGLLLFQPSRRADYRSHHGSA